MDGISLDWPEDQWESVSEIVVTKDGRPVSMTERDNVLRKLKAMLVVAQMLGEIVED